jgi:hypothetical protein
MLLWTLLYYIFGVVTCIRLEIGIGDIQNRPSDLMCAKRTHVQTAWSGHIHVHALRYFNTLWISELNIG